MDGQMQLAEWRSGRRWLNEWMSGLTDSAAHSIRFHSADWGNGRQCCRISHGPHRVSIRISRESLIKLIASCTRLSAPSQREGGWRATGRAARLLRQLTLKFKQDSCPVISIVTHLAMQSVSCCCWQTTEELQRRQMHESMRTRRQRSA